MTYSRLFIAAMLLFVCTRATLGADAAVTPPAGRMTLPQDHEYQRTLRNYIASLSEKDFAHGVTTPVSGGCPCSRRVAR